MAFTLRWSEEALEDIESIATYIEKDSPTYAKSVVSKFFETHQQSITKHSAS
jgi:plasmid stabilization system protein ParE